MEQTRENFYKMTALVMTTFATGAAIGLFFPALWKAVVPVPQGRQGLFDFIMLVLSMSAFIGGGRAALAIEAYWLPRCEMSNEQRESIEKYTLPLRASIDRLVMWLAGGCVLVVLFNYL